ncbi:hypothetical protein [Marinicellulosiphila megalodicopiae]|uniref:hypothetical protein n=1 Tax=Marinicellulosiphila megalodicopiae TaxID=2724896 RepID=UPI003BAF77B9
MKKNKKVQKRFTGRGPIARKLIESAATQLKNKITHIQQWQEGKFTAEQYQKSIVSEKQLSDLDPLHALYMYAQNQLSVLIEQVGQFPSLEKLTAPYAHAVDEYLPSGPPSSPITKSYFTCWGAFDLSTQGAKKETLCTVATDFCKFINADNSYIDIFEKMQSSSMGIYKHLGQSGKFINLKELVTNKEIKVICPSGYNGRSGEIWLARIFPALFDHIDYSVVFTTPYVLGNQNQDDHQVEKNWLDFFERNMKNTKQKQSVASYNEIMKYGLSTNYWNEYIFLAYKNFQPNVVFLEGMPDIKSSLPLHELARD